MAGNSTGGDSGKVKFSAGNYNFVAVMAFAFGRMVMPFNNDCTDSACRGIMLLDDRAWGDTEEEEEGIGTL